MIRELICVAALAAAMPARAQDAPALRKLLDEAAQASPELQQARAELAAFKARVPQAGALPDPSLSLGIQNDGFTRIAVGEMETSFYSIALTQPLPWPGKRGLREDIAGFDVRQAEARLSRAQLGLDASVRRAWLGLLLTHAQLEVLDEQDPLWLQAEQTARSRYESGQVPQSDLLRAQLERARLQQRRWSLEADLSERLAELNRLRAHPLDEPVTPDARLENLPDAVLPPEPAAQADAEARSPELQLAELAREQAGRRVELSRKEKLPDFAVTAGVMPRGGLTPMWQLGVSIGLPIFSQRGRAVDESEQRRIGQAQAAEALRQVLRLRTHQRLTALAVLNRTNQQYRKEVLVLSAAAARSTLTQYEVARVPFAAVLEALSGYSADRASFYGSVADAQLAAIAQQEVSLDAVPSSGGGSAGAMPGTSQGAPRPGAASPGAAGMEAAAPQRSTNGM